MVRAPDYIQKESWFKALANELAKGKSMISILDDLMTDITWPTSGTFYHWTKQHPELKGILDEGREHGLVRAVEEMIDIADRVKPDKGAIAKARLRILAREKQARMLAPRLFKESVDITSDGEKLEAPQQNVMVENRLQSLLAIAMARKAGTLPPPIDVPKLDPKRDLLGD